MATANRSIFNSESVVSPATPEKIRRLEKGPARQNSDKKLDPAHEDQLRALARADSLGWKICESGPCPEAFEKKWRSASDALTRACDWLLQLVTRGSRLATGAKPLLDSSFMLRMALEESHDGLKRARKLPLIANLEFGRVPRAWALAESLLGALDFDFDERSLSIFIQAAQENAPLTSDEVWVLKSFLQFALLERIGAIAARLISSNKGQTDGTKLLLDAGKDYLSILVRSLGLIADLDWKEVFETINQTDRILRDDPAEAYSRMDFESRQAYRQSVAELASRSRWSEQEIAQKAVALARKAQNAGTQDPRARERRSHVGFYLLGEGNRLLQAIIGYRPSLPARLRESVLRHPHIFYFLGIGVITGGVITAILHSASGLGVEPSLALALALALLLLLPAAECAVAIANQLSAATVRPKVLPKLDFSKGIPAESSTMVVVPMLLISEAQVRKAVRDLEIRYLANRGPNLYFALLTDVPDSAEQFDERDQLAGFCSSLIEDLNRKHGSWRNAGSFFLFHRHRSYNPAEQRWMGWERKRGKLLDFNSLLLADSDSFPVKVGDLSVLKHVRYVITLDLDTQLPRDSARRLVGALAHPLNRAVIDPQANTVVEGYGILQPRVEISIDSAARSRLASLFSGDTGFDIYTRAVSDVYQDLFGEGTYAGKGIYEVSTFQTALKHRFPTNTLLSHDMIEGAYARAGLVSDVEVIDDYPSHFSTFCRRKHRWVRGDWQIIFSLLPRVADYFGETARNPLTFISRWKIVDNLRRSLTEFATLVLLVCGWLVFPGRAAYWTLAALGTIALPTYFEFALSIARAGGGLFTKAFWRNLGSNFSTANAHLFFRLAFLCHQSLVMLDAVIRTLVRIAITHKRLLEWETAAESEAMTERKSPVENYLDWTVLLSLAIGVAIAVFRPSSLIVASPLLVLWASSKYLGEWLNRPPRRRGRTRIRPRDEALLRDATLRTWRFFREYSHAGENWLIPDIVGEAPPRVAHRTSTTNLGLLLNARLGAYDLGFLTLEEFATETERTFDTIDQMPKHNGHLFNWYDNQSLEAVRPRFVSTVDNANLVCCLWTLASGCREIAKQRLFRRELWQGIQDHVHILSNILGESSEDQTLHSAIELLDDRVRTLDTPELPWLGALPQLGIELTAFERKLADAAAPDEAKWWAHELLDRVTSLERMVENFAPWLLPQFAKYCEGSDIQVRLGDLTLGTAPKIHAELDRNVEKRGSVEDTGSEAARTAGFLRSALSRSAALSEAALSRLSGLAHRSDSLAKEMDFKFLYNPKKKLLSIGYEVEENRVSPYYYDLLASEARAAYFVAIARGDIPQESWFQLSRSHTIYKRESMLVSWTGTMFEYLMPLLWMKPYPNTMLLNSARAAVRAQRKYTRGRAPWGISECACNERDPAGIDYRYHAFGVPGLALNPGNRHDLVISPYSTFLALMVDAASAMRNLKWMEKRGWLGPCGFYEAGDFTPSRIASGQEFGIVRCWMAHHQGMSFVAATNILADSPMQRRFHAEPLVAATERLLHERATEQKPVELTAESSAEPPAAPEPSFQPEFREPEAIVLMPSVSGSDRLNGLPSLLAPVSRAMSAQVRTEASGPKPALKRVAHACGNSAPDIG
jgi:cyclic beta-1,2-glucan synthetase